MNTPTGGNHGAEGHAKATSASEAQDSSSSNLESSRLIAHARAHFMEQLHWGVVTPHDVDQLISVVQEETRQEMTKALSRSDQPQPRSCPADPRGDDRGDSIQPETCICAAVRLEDGRTFYGHRHHNAMAAAREHGFDGLVRQEMQGFLTSRGRFVGRTVGLALQEAAMVPSARGAYNGRALFSEDLY